MYKSELKAFASKKLVVSQVKRFDLDGVENIVEMGENAAYQQFIFFPLTMFYKVWVLKDVKTRMGSNTENGIRIFKYSLWEIVSGLSVIKFMSLNTFLFNC